MIVPEVILLRRSGSGEEVGEELEIEEDELVGIPEEVGEELVVEEDKLLEITEEEVETANCVVTSTELDEVVNEVSARRAITKSSGHVGSSQVSDAVIPCVKQRERMNVMILVDRVRGQVDNMAISVRSREGYQSDQV